MKNGTMMIIHGAQGSGKSIVLELFCELLGKYALANVDDLDKVFGKFNSLLSNHLLININEPPEADDKFRFNGSSIVGGVRAPNNFYNFNNRFPEAPSRISKQPS